MEPFITFKDTDKNGELQYYILQRAFPHFCGVILNVPPEDSLMVAPVSGYHLYITFAGTLQGNYLLSRADIEKQLYDVFSSMASWYYENRVLKDQKRYKKFKI